eukprot:6203438-Pleurochrysis_carterae.AAC.4
MQAARTCCASTVPPSACMHQALSGPRTPRSEANTRAPRIYAGPRQSSNTLQQGPIKQPGALSAPTQ